MDFNDSPEEAAWRTEFGAWLDEKLGLKPHDGPAEDVEPPTGPAQVAPVARTQACGFHGDHVQPRNAGSD